MKQKLLNAQIVLADGVSAGSLEIRDGVIANLLGEAAGASDTVIDCQGDFLISGMIDIHTDNLEVHIHPRPTVQWPEIFASAINHDWQVLCSGITTVFDSVAIGDFHSSGKRSQILDNAIAALDKARAAGVLKVDHLLHLRCELCDQKMLPIVERIIDNPAVKLVSMMDHTPGQRQWHDARKFREMYRKKGIRVWTDQEFEADMVTWRRQQAELVPVNRTAIRTLCEERNIVMASHDDTTVADIDEAHADGITISEFPTTVDAARRAHTLGMKTVMGSPNIVLGGSHSGNVSAAHLAELGLLDVLTSDYVPGSLLHATFMLASRGTPLHKAVAMVTKTPAELLNLHDRGRIADELRADLVRVRLIEGVPVIQNVWVSGRQFM
ncbi:alpha-D-ribose 1-methylphosphonate 5-triphosphate diphosphatase [Rhizobium leguminosarum]|uniref:alpha-D-ribose 1-methylphosphonate 5-triphosphate diphosphatase n=1 Tax=Rhizobium leguminosarum TaxID=384 RepID=UPI001C984357|nr:alpha-D-ribose 1-methylphosphonate 5-triphosphate diphosphatase [Rhizobium leguminosarum]MBY5720913.1 alpha-D-ribose 1-methylphosphonate 5-triphosphate diphosphatase [Rhizobium leguminosarum]